MPLVASVTAPQLNVGVSSFVMALSAGDAGEGTGGGVSSMVIVRVAETPDTFPALSTARTFQVYTLSLKAVLVTEVPDGLAEYTNVAPLYTRNW